ncbi:hypothetical protein CPB83DRAFT_897626 [Crepidotus variabilis]|uniref:Uncharacterized protein n=1 Tax=Crepidotus variabilis TaxID=179855 RepID=A0A9P6E8K5_9AGAR|nr:hypothetical protein CPB83DRAFT_897626 [Crepidotus variabilis]
MVNKRCGSPIEKSNAKVPKTDNQILEAALGRVTKQNLKRAPVTTLTSLCKNLHLSDDDTIKMATKHTLQQILTLHLKNVGILSLEDQQDYTLDERKLVRVRVFRDAGDFETTYMQEERVRLNSKGGLDVAMAAFQMGFTEGHLEPIDPLRFKRVFIQDSIISADLLPMLQGDQGFIRTVHTINNN